MDTDFAAKIGSVLAFVVGLCTMLAVVFGIFKLIDWARETRRMAEEALETKAKERDGEGDSSGA